jgi:indolepyruvate ferredoxin oxidoreductase
LRQKKRTGELVKRPFGPWIRSAFRVLASMKGLRGTPFDPFAYTSERKTERALIEEYRATIEELLPALAAENIRAAVELARLPEGIRGFGHVKLRHLAVARAKWQELVSEWRQTVPHGAVR